MLYSYCASFAARDCEIRTFCVSCALDWHGVIQCFSTLTNQAAEARSFLHPSQAWPPLWAQILENIWLWLYGIDGKYCRHTQKVSFPQIERRWTRWSVEGSGVDAAVTDVVICSISACSTPASAIRTLDIWRRVILNLTGEYSEITAQTITPVHRRHRSVGS